ncbi:hypothetical protein FQN55_004988 [Onygenales sp. PD_40]|nr:hypothetical protein FQN55_004988 [Onygenales sp. PD_40]
MLPSRIKPILHPPRPPPTTTTTIHPAARPSSPALSYTSTDTDPEDVLTSFLPHLFPDEAPSCLGEPGKAVAYASGIWGDVTVMVPDYPKEDEEEDGQGEEVVEGGGGVEEGRRLFAHYLWGGGLVIAEGIERAVRAAGVKGGESLAGRGERDLLWRVEGERVLEVGAGAALPSLIASLAGAAQVTITDHPSSPALYGAIQENITNNIPTHIRSRISIQPHEWGVLGPTPQDGAKIEETSTSQGGQTRAVQFAMENKASFTRVIAADCLWMRDQHENLARSLLWFLAPPGEERGGGGVAWVVAGFHTGREIVASFFETAVAMGLVVERIWERDVNATSEEGEVTREWMAVRPGEGPENRARWCVVAFLRRGE